MFKPITGLTSVLALAALCTACDGDFSPTQGVDREATLSSLSLSVGSLVPEFDPTVRSYTATVPNDTERVEVFAVTADVFDTFEINGRRETVIPLEVGDNNIFVEVESEDGLKGRTYRILVSRLPAAEQAVTDLMNADDGRLFGLATVLSLDGDTLAVGSVDKNAVTVYSRDSGTWKWQADVAAADGGHGDLFGISVALSGDGNTLVVGAIDEDSISIGVNGDALDNSAPRSGAAYVFTRDSGGVWTQEAYLKASNTDAGDLFGLITALSEDGNTLAVAAPDEDSAATGVNGDQSNNSQADSGAVYVFAREPGGAWAQQAYVKPSKARDGDTFAWVMSMPGDGDVLAVGAFDGHPAVLRPVSNGGDAVRGRIDSIYVFARDRDGHWTEQRYIDAQTAEPVDTFHDLPAGGAPDSRVAAP